MPARSSGPLGPDLQGSINSYLMLEFTSVFCRLFTRSTFAMGIGTEFNYALLRDVALLSPPLK
jgi:hypothetical protein